MSIADQRNVPARHQSRALVVRPAGFVLVALLFIGLVGGLIVTAAPAVLLIRAGFAGGGGVALVVGAIFGLWRMSRVAVWADEAGITVRNVWTTDLLRWKRVDRIVSDRRLWLPGLRVPTLRLRGDDTYLPMLGAVAFGKSGGIEPLRDLWRGNAISS